MVWPGAKPIGESRATGMQHHLDPRAAKTGSELGSASLPVFGRLILFWVSTAFHSLAPQGKGWGEWVAMIPYCTAPAPSSLLLPCGEKVGNALPPLLWPTRIDLSGHLRIRQHPTTPQHRGDGATAKKRQAQKAAKKSVGAAKARPSA